MRAPLLLVLLAALLAVPAAAQDPADLPFSLELVETDLAGMPALHSFAWAQRDGRWLFVAGRTDGLHGGLQGFDPDPFPDELANDVLWVVDPATGEAWSRPLDELGAALADPLRATNPQAERRGETLYVVGGYGNDTATGSKVTFPTLTALDLPGVIAAVVGGGALAPHVRQLRDERLAVTGGELLRVGERFYLVVGQRFDGEYVEGGAGSDFEQTYTEAIASFGIEDDGTSLALADYAVEAESAEHLHRRDLTVAPLVIGGEPGFALYGGVFRPDIPLPFLYPVAFAPGAEPALLPDEAFEQKISHYTAPALPLYDAETGATHTTLFGGIGLFAVSEETGEAEQDYLVPFIDDVTTVTRAADGSYTETIQPFRLPGLLGTNAVFIPSEDAPSTENEVLLLGDLGGRTLVGHIVGGLEAEMPHPGRLGGTSAPSRRVFEVWVTPFATAAEPGSTPLALALDAPYPNPFRSEATVALVLDRAAAVSVEVFDVLGRRVARLHDGPLAGGRRHAFTLRGDDLAPGVYLVRASGDGLSATRPLVRVR